MTKLISIVIPAYNEGKCVDELARRLRMVFDRYEGRYAFEVIVVENGSFDDTYEKLRAIHSQDPRFKILRLQRNFDMEGGLCAGIAQVTGDACVTMAGDLQDPPELIPQFIEEWEAGYENVYQIVTHRAESSLFRRAAAQAFYWLIHTISEHPVPRNASDFRLVDRRLYEAFNSMPERNRMVRSMWTWVGGKSIGIEHRRPPRFGGTSTFNGLRTAGFAIRGILSSSYMPLKVIPLVGVTFSAISFVAFGIYTVRWVFAGVPFAGFGTIVSLNLLCFGVLFLMLGLVSEYIGMIYEEVRGRPTFIIKEALGLEPIVDGQQVALGRRLTRRYTDRFPGALNGTTQYEPAMPAAALAEEIRH
jgi:glycosyltransferase involved in cell wall biosynthesis